MKMRRLAAIVKRAALVIWIEAGILLLLIVVCNAAAGLFLRLTHPPHPDGRVYADAYGNAHWTAEYYRELEGVEVQWHPYLYWISKPYQSRFINIGEDGLRVTWRPSIPDRAAQIRPFRIFVFGGSTIWGEGQRDEYTIPSIIQRLLQSAPYPVEVTNFGQPGYVTTQEVLLLQEQLRNGNIPDLAVFYDGHNDISSALTNHAAGVTYDEDARRREFNISNWHKLPDRRRIYWEFTRSLVFNSNLGQIAQQTAEWLAPNQYHLIKGRLTRVIHKAVGERDVLSEGRLEDEVVCDYLYNKGVVERYSRRYGFRALFYWQPVIYTKPRLTAYERRQADDPGLRGQKNFFLAIYRRIAEIREKEGIHDLSGVFGSSPQPCFLDDVHVSEAGNLIVAQAMLHGIRQLLDTMKPRSVATPGGAHCASNWRSPSVEGGRQP